MTSILIITIYKIIFKYLRSFTQLNIENDLKILVIKYLNENMSLL